MSDNNKKFNAEFWLNFLISKGGITLLYLLSGTLVLVWIAAALYPFKPFFHCSFWIWVLLPLAALVATLFLAYLLGIIIFMSLSGWIMTRGRLILRKVVTLFICLLLSAAALICFLNRH